VLVVLARASLIRSLGLVIGLIGAAVAVIAGVFALLAAVFAGLAGRAGWSQPSLPTSRRAA